MLNTDFGSTMGLAAGYGIHQSSNESITHASNNRTICGPHSGCDSKQVAACPGLSSSWCLSNSANTASPLRCARRAPSPNNTTPPAYDYPAPSWPNTRHSGPRQAIEMPPPIASLSSVDESDMFDPFEQAQQASRKSSQSRPSIDSTQSISPDEKMEMFDSASPEQTAPSRSNLQRRSTQAPTPSRPNRLPHSVIERRYRDNLNRQLDTLRNRLPNFQDTFACSGEIEDSGLPAKWPSKAVIIAAAIKYIGQIESERDRAKAHAKGLQDQVSGLQKLVRCDDCSILKYLETLQLNSDITNY